MSSKTAKTAKAPKLNPMHRSAWRSMRILREWTIPGIVRTIPGAGVAGVTRYVKALERHAMVEKLPGYQKGRAGDHQRYRIYQKLSDQPIPPQTCHLCGAPVSARICDPSLKKTETETGTGRKGNKRAERLAAQFAALPPLTEAELKQAEAELYPKTERETERETKTETKTETKPALAQYPNEGFHVLPEALKRRLIGGLNDAT